MDYDIANLVIVDQNSKKAQAIGVLIFDVFLICTALFDIKMQREE
jgi:hypothetical protein